VVTLGVDDATLGIHHVVVFEQALTDTVVVLLYAALSILYRLRHHIVLYHLVFLEAEAVEHLHHIVRGEKAHYRILERDEEYRRTGVALTSGTTAQLTVDTP